MQLRRPAGHRDGPLARGVPRHLREARTGTRSSATSHARRSSGTAWAWVRTHRSA